jgi:hypothetical protein
MCAWNSVFPNIKYILPYKNLMGRGRARINAEKRLRIRVLSVYPHPILKMCDRE